MRRTRYILGFFGLAALAGLALAWERWKCDVAAKMRSSCKYARSVVR